MRSIYWACGVCALLVAGLLVARQAETKAPKTLAYEEIVKLLEKQRGVLFIDVREPNEIEVTGTLKGALTIPVGQLEQRLSEVPKDKPIVAFCRRGGRATRAANLLDEKGYKTLGVFGLEAYHEQLKDYIVYPKQ
jgi:rhodanese-related sulfurtransferase